MEIKIEILKPEFAEALAELQKICLPTLGEAEWLKKEHFLKHCELFPEGNFVAVVNEQPVALGSGFLYPFDLEAPDHTFNEIIAGGYYTNHDPKGDWYYGADISVHPHFRRRGIGQMLYEARKGVVKRLNKKGIVAGGLIPGYAKYKDHMSPHDYVDYVIAGDVHDGTLTFQLQQGFKVQSLLKNYIEDKASDNWATLIVWENEDYDPDKG
jgi:GNAT superfamily N-acetyltransferase